MKYRNIFLFVHLVLFFVLSYSTMAQQYCIPPNYITGPYTGITNVHVGSINNTSASDDGYTNYSSTVGVCTVSRGNTVSFSITCYYDPSMVSSFTGNLNFRVWIDWNADFDFNDAGEEAISSTINCKAVTSANPLTTATFAFIVPPGAVLGNTRMRVYEDMMPSDGHETPTPCGYNSGLGQHGEAEDYEMNITIASGVTAIEKKPGITIYPNPANDYLYITPEPIDDRYTTHIYNTSGQLVVSNLTGDNGSANTLNISGLSSGMYLVIVMNKEGEKLASVKLIK